jgi:hypothetical protein
LSLFHGLKLQSGVLELTAGSGKLLSRLRQFFGQLGRHLGDLLCDDFSELHLNFCLDDVQFVVEVTIRGLLCASDSLVRSLGRSLGRCGPNCAIFVVSQHSFTAIFFLPVHIIFFLH